MTKNKGVGQPKLAAEVARIQRYLRESARLQYQTVIIPPFAVFFHASNPAIYFNYAIPEEVPAGDLHASLAGLRAAFAARRRRPRFEFIAEFAPGLDTVLQANGFEEDARLQLMICTPDRLRPAPEVPDLRITELGAHSPAADLHDYALTVRQGFNPQSHEMPTGLDVDRTREEMRNGRSFLGRLGGEPAGVASYTPPLDGVTEVVGIATREPFRRRGVAAALTAHAVTQAFGEGATLACLTAGDARAGRVYERVGFQPFATMLFYVEPAEATAQ